MLIAEIIRKKRDRNVLTADEIQALVTGIADDSASDAQIAAFAMSVLLNGMDRQEAAALTLAMRDSGDVFDWSDLPGPVVDKHSTGGVGDNVSLMLAPIVAACGAYVPMISGRGLGHTGGTLDKMETIPGYIATPDNAMFSDSSEQSRLRHNWADRAVGARRQAILWHSGCHCDCRKHPSDHGFDPVQKTCGRSWVTGDGCEVRQWRFHVEF